MSIKAFDKSGLSERRQQRLRGADEQLPSDLQDVTSTSAVGGLLQTGSPAMQIYHRKALNETVIQNGERNSFIIFGEDRPAGLGTGLGSQGASPRSRGTNRIELVVGKMARAEGLEDGTTADPSPFGDGSKIYIADVTKNARASFGFCESPISTERNQGVIMGFSDQIRLFGLNGVHITTGRPAGPTGRKPFTTAAGAKIEQCAPIVLSAGNFNGTYEVIGPQLPSGDYPVELVNHIQPAVKGDNMVACVTELGRILDKVIGALIRMATVQGAFGAIEAIQVPPIINPHFPAAAGFYAQETFRTFTRDLYALRIDAGAWESTYTTERAPKSIKSTNVYVS
tara:strand:- start:1162 stop:2181 length:1020 start_codon:yes stop_codon:yes gene_type:complete